MSEIFASPYFGVALSVIAFGIGVKLNQKFKTPFCNPLIIAIVLVSAVLLIFKIPYEDYNKGGEIINMFLAPATACLAVAVYTKLQILKQYWFPILVGCAAGLRHLWAVCIYCAGSLVRGKPDRFFAAEIRDHADRSQHRRTGGRYGADHSCGGDLYRDPGRDLRTASHPPVPRIGSGCGWACHRGIESRCGNFQGDRTGRDRGGDERTCHRHLRDHYCVIFWCNAGTVTGSITECFERNCDMQYEE